MTLTAAYVRVYYNHGKDTSDKQWSIDFGPGTIEVLVTSISINNRRVETKLSEGITINLVQPIGVHSMPLSQPQAWMEVKDVEVEFQGTHAIIKPR